MSLDPFTAGFDLVKTSLDKIFPDANTELQGKLAKAASLISNDYNLQLAQITANTEEAKHSSLLVAGARPAAMWVGVIALAYGSFGTSLLSWIAVCFGLPPLPPLSNDMATTVLTALLGIGGMRSFDKVRGTDTKKIVTSTSTSTSTSKGVK